MWLFENQGKSPAMCFNAHRLGCLRRDIMDGIMDWWKNWKGQGQIIWTKILHACDGLHGQQDYNTTILRVFFVFNSIVFVLWSAVRKWISSIFLSTTSLWQWTTSSRYVICEAISTSCFLQSSYFMGFVQDLNVSTVCKCKFCRQCGTFVINDGT